MAFKRALLILGAAFVIGNASGASAADLGTYEGSIKDAPYIAQSAAPSWYARVDGSWAFYDVDDVSLLDHDNGTPPAGTPTVFSNLGSDVDDGWSIGGGIGRKFGNGFRGDLTLEYRGSTDLNGSASASCCDLLETDTQFDGIVGLANLYYDFNRGGFFNPYVGAGLGGVYHATSAGTTQTGGTIASSSDWDVAGALMAGFTLAIHERLSLDAGYRFLYLGETKAGGVSDGINFVRGPSVEDIHAHEFRVGLRYDIR